MTAKINEVKESATAKSNGSLGKAKKIKNDEFYTQFTDIEDELKHYAKHFEGKVVFCNCDDPEMSQFYRFFKAKFQNYKLKKLITTHYTENNLYDKAYKLECVIIDDVNGEPVRTESDLKSNGDFRDDECIELLKQSDIICTNPPFSLFREYIAQLVEHNKKFLIVGNYNSITYKETFELIKENKLWIGVSPRSMTFTKKDKTTADVNAAWFTNLTHEKRDKEFIYLKEKYVVDNYPKYDNYDAIEVSKVKNIPVDYKGLMGVPITFLEKYNPKQFEIIGIDRVLIEELTGKVRRFTLHGRENYARIVIKHKHPQQ